MSNIFHVRRHMWQPFEILSPPKLIMRAIFERKRFCQISIYIPRTWESFRNLGKIGVRDIVGKNVEKEMAIFRNSVNSEANYEGHI